MYSQLNDDEKWGAQCDSEYKWVHHPHAKDVYKWFPNIQFAEYPAGHQTLLDNS